MKKISIFLFFLLAITFPSEAEAQSCNKTCQKMLVQFAKGFGSLETTCRFYANGDISKARGRQYTSQVLKETMRSPGKSALKSIKESYSDTCGEILP